MSDEATARPWALRPQRFDDWGYIRGPMDDDGFMPLAAIARCAGNPDLNEHRRNGTDPYEANAALIVRAVNAYDDLIEALETLPDRFEEASNNPCTCRTDEIGCPYCNAWEAVVRDVRAVLSRAQEQSAAIPHAETGGGSTPASPGMEGN